jgi:predicted anti-sigma-YlaC factor YlaD
MEGSMKADGHETIRHVIDKSLAGEASPQEERSLREHLRDCAQCQEYLSGSSRVIASLGGFSFDVDPGLQAKVLSSLKLRAQQLEARQPSRRRIVWGWMIAFVLMVIGSYIASQFGGVAAGVLDLQPMQVQRALLAFWVVPSLCFWLLFPLLPLLSAGWTNRKGRVL